MSFGELLKYTILATSVDYKKKKEQAREDKLAEKEQIRIEKKAAEQERVRLDENAYRLIYNTPDGGWGEHVIGSPRKLPNNAKIVKMGNIKNGWTDYKGQSVIEDLYNFNGVPRTMSQMREELGPDIDLMDVPKKFPFVGQIIDNKYSVLPSDQLKAFARPDLITTKDKFFIGGKEVADETEAIKINKETGDPIRHVTQKFVNGQLNSESERNYEEPGKDKGEEFWYMLVDGMPVKSKDPEYFLGRGYKKEDLSRGNFVGNKLVSQPMIELSSSYAVEYEFPDGSTKLSTDPDFTPTDRTKAIGEKRVEILPNGTTKPLAASTPRTPPETVAKQAKALEMSRYLAYIKLPDDTVIGINKGNVSERALELKSKTLDKIELINKTPGLAQKYFDTFGSVLKEHMDTDPNANAVQKEMPDGLLIGHKAKLVSMGFGSLLEIKGMDRFLTSLDMQGNADKAAQIQKTLEEENSKGVVVVANEPLIKDGETLPYANLIFGRVADVKYKSFINQTLFPMLYSITSDKETATNLLSTFIADEKDYLGNAKQREDKNGPIPAQNQYTLDAMMSMSSTVIVPGTKDKKPVTELDVFFAMINSTDPDNHPVLKALTPGRKKAIANKFSSMINNDLETAVLSVRNLISVGGPDTATLLFKKYGLSKSAQGQQRRNSFLAQKESATRGTDVAKNSIGSYFDPSTGKMYGSTAVVNFDLTMDGLAYLGKEIVTRLRGVVGSAGGDIDSVAVNIVDSLIATGLKQKNGAIRITEDARQRLVNDARLVSSQISAAGNDVEKRLIATRNFHITVLAYELAAAIQGGTGGRTISDQDVQLILGALRQGKFDDPEAQVASLMAAKEMLDNIRIRATYLSSSDYLDNAAVAIADDFLATADVLPTAASVANELRSQLGGTGFSAEDKVKGMSDRQIIMMMNRHLPAGEKLKLDDPIDKNSPAYQLMLKSLKKGQSS